MCIGQHVPTNAESLFVWKARLLWGKGAPFSLAPFFNCLILSTNFGQPKTWPVCRFRYCFLDICIRTIQLKYEGWGAFFLLQPARIILWASTHWPSSQARRTSMNSKHSTLTFLMTGAANPLKKWIDECSFLKATQCWPIRQTGPVFSTQNRYTKWDIR